MSGLKEIRVVVVGDEKCGKTSLISRFISDDVPGVYKPTGFDKFFTTKELGGELVSFTVWDTSGSTNYDSVRPLSYSEADIFIICFKICDPISLYNVKSHWIVEIQKHSSAPIILCGCMADLRGDELTLAHLSRIGRTAVSLEQALAISSQIGARSYVETQSKDSYSETLDAFSVAAVTALESRRLRSLASERPESVNSNASSKKSGNLNKSKSSFYGSYSSISGSIKNFEDNERNAHNISETILENDVFENLSPRLGGKPPGRPLSPSSLPTSPLSLPTSPAKPKPPLTNPTSPYENPNLIHFRSASQPVRSNLEHLRPNQRTCSPPTLPSRAPSPPPRPSKPLTSPITEPPELRPKPHLSRKTSFRSSMPVGKPPLPSQLPKSPTDLLNLPPQKSPITIEPLSKSRLTQLGVPEGKNYESLKSHTSTASHGSTGSKISTGSSQMSAHGGWSGPRDLNIPDTEDPELLKNLDFTSPKAGVYRPVNAGKNSKKDKCSVM